MSATVALSILAPWPDLPWLARAPGAVPLVFGALLVARHARLFEQVGTNIKTFDDPGTFVRTNAFAWTRNPMYLGFVLVLVGISVLSGAAASVAGPLVFYGAADRWYIPFEERRMAATFGTDYHNYMRTVHRWIGPRAS